MRIDDVIWLESVVEKLESKHGVDPIEVEEVLAGDPEFRRGGKGSRKGEDLYYALGQTEAGRYLFVVFIRKPKAKLMATIPKFKSLEEAAAFWDTHDFEDYRDDTESVAIKVRLPRRQKALTIPLDLRTYQQIEALAERKRMGIDKLVAKWLKEWLLAETAS